MTSINILITEARKIKVPQEILTKSKTPKGTIFEMEYSNVRDTIILRPTNNHVFIDADGVICFSSELWQELDFYDEDRIKVSYDEILNEISITPLSHECRICGEKEGEVEVSIGNFICDNCMFLINEKQA